MELPASRSNQRYHGSRMRHLEFADFWPASGTQRRSLYNTFREQSEYVGLPAYTNQDEAAESLRTWEQDHPEDCERSPDEGQFFGFSEVGEAHLERHTAFLLIPAVQEASDLAADKSGSEIGALLDIVVRNALSRSEALDQLREEVQNQYREILADNSLHGLDNLLGSLNDALKRFVPTAGVDINWSSEGAVDITAPRAAVRLIESGFAADVSRAGHGVQRAFILTLLQQLAAVTSSTGESDNDPTSETSEGEPAATVQLPTLVLAIEEPELYLHPNLQHHLREILSELAEGAIPGVARRTQILFTTHSPLMLSIQNFDAVRRLMKQEREPGQPLTTICYQSSLTELAETLETASQAPQGTYTSTTLQARLEPMVTPMINEGFFADLVVLVEGEEDHAYVHASVQLEIERRHLPGTVESNGISIIPCVGANNLDRPYAIFTALGIPTYLIWDNDSDKAPDEGIRQRNRRLLRLVDALSEDWPAAVEENWACFNENLTNIVRLEIGQEIYVSVLQEAASYYGYGASDARKNPLIVKSMIMNARGQGTAVPTLDLIANRIVEKRFGPEPIPQT